MWELEASKLKGKTKQFANKKYVIDEPKPCSDELIRQLLSLPEIEQEKMNHKI